MQNRLKNSRLSGSPSTRCLGRAAVAGSQRTPSTAILLRWPVHFMYAGGKITFTDSPAGTRRQRQQRPRVCL